MTTVIVGVVACSSEQDQPQSSRIKVAVSIPPQVDAVSRIGGDRVTIDAIIDPGFSPTTFDPSPAQLTFLSEADIYFTIGVPFEEKLLPRIKAALPRLQIINTNQNLPWRSIEDHHHDGESVVLNRDPHTWLAPLLVSAQANVICSALVAADPSAKEYYQQNLKRFTSDMKDLNAQIGSILAPFAGDTIYVFHPSFGYFADAYSLTQVAVESGGKEPDAAYMAELAGLFSRHEVPVIFVQPQFASSAAEALAEAVGARVDTLDPLAGDYEHNLLDMAQRVARALGQ